jgi:hypothetical protein
MLVIGKNSIESKVQRESRERAAIRRQEDIHKGLTSSSGPCRGDFPITKTFDKCMSDYRRFKSPADRAKISAEYHGLQREGRRR